MIINLPRFQADSTYFNAITGDFSALEIRSSGANADFYYFYDTADSRLVTEFILDDLPRVQTLCRVILIKLEDGFSPRLCFWKRDKSKAGKEKVQQEIENSAATRDVKAVVDTADGWKGLWNLISFLQSFKSMTPPTNTFRVVSGSEAEIAGVLQGADKGTVIEAVRSALGGSLTEHDIQVLADRKGQLEEFRRLLEDEDHFEAARQEAGGSRERVWQRFFEANQWIFGYGLQLVSCDSADADRLEKITTGASFFAGGGKRVDGLLLTRGYVSSLVFCEIKHHQTDLLQSEAYREPDVYQASKELSGGVAQVQKTAYKAVRGIVDNIREHYLSDGTPTDVSYSVVRPRQVLVIGNLAQLAVGGRINPERSLSFELYRRSMHEVEILTFDELYQRAQYIVKESAGKNEIPD
ncbi:MULTISPECIES: Shedu immune nuclease family protein [unclassified Frankia]|uniref:Shedu immune nuclease family protein n=1 Tax=unclassified Frankia TaxID=2632575 RepID=UPI001933CC01|nr:MULTISPECIES: Shedu immune nuclease family protein [unclassified Frankia]MBL7618158.1 DUF4263 domain-containing protein [Frankia sp. AgB1.8]